MLLPNMTIDATTLGTGRTLPFDWAGIADGSRSPIELTPVGIDSPHPLQHLALRTAILISLRFIAEVGGRPDLIPLFPIGQGHIGTNACVFQRFDVLDGAILRITRHLVRVQFPAKAGAKDEVTHRLVIHDFRRRHQYLEDDACFAAIDDIVGMIPQMRASPFQPHRGGIRISRADPQVGGALIIPTHFSLRPSLFGDPVMPRCNFLSEFLSLWLSKGDWQ